MSKENFSELAKSILSNIGGEQNVTSVTHCMTRLRFNLKDESLIQEEKLKKIPQVLSLVKAGGQTQVVIGPTVNKVYSEVINIMGHQESNENIMDFDEEVKKKITLKSIGNGILNGITGSIAPVLPIFIVSGILKMFAFLLGPGMFSILSSDSHLVTLFNMIGDSVFYYLPVFVAYTAAKHFNCNRVISLLLGLILVYPDMLSIVDAGEPFSVYGIPMPLINYTKAVIPIIISIWIFSYVEKSVKKIVPETLLILGVPVLSVLVMLPIILLVVGPLSTSFMSLMASGIIWMSNTVGIVAITIIGGAWTLIIAVGLHLPILMTLLPANMEIGYDAIVSPGTISTVFATLAVAIGYGIRARRKEDRAVGWGFFITYAFGMVSEPLIYGLLLRNMKALAWTIIGGACGGLTMGLLSAKVYIFSSVGLPFMNPLRFGPDLIKGIIGCAVAFGVTLVLSLVFGFEIGEHKSDLK